MKIKPHGLFNTPKSMEEVENWIQSHSKEMHIHLYTAAFMTWNYLAAELAKEKEDA